MMVVDSAEEMTGRDRRCSRWPGNDGLRTQFVYARCEGVLMTAITDPEDQPVVAFDPRASLLDSGVLEAIGDLLAPLSARQRDSIEFTLANDWLEGGVPSRNDIRRMIDIVTGVAAR
jgi:hypothetical protein